MTVHPSFRTVEPYVAPFPALKTEANYHRHHYPVYAFEQPSYAAPTYTYQPQPPEYHHQWPSYTLPVAEPEAKPKATRAKRAKQDTKEYKKEWYAAHRDAQKEKMKAWYEKNKAKRLLQMKAYNSRRLQMQREAKGLNKPKASPSKASLNYILCD
ncbi:hypothetical protein ACHHYP_16588 [Achlya hypogyna]|uniref:Uncharacterized protein n=1 Tax=Achlya hypogyna TaxID=1202772 RepID=A0A1V9ZEF1_ACHHY|nr:hypothetical protein ACHHYP_16588 [Achlya hypogyna]